MYEFLKSISSLGGYKLYADNKWGIPFETIDIYKNGVVKAYFYLDGKRTYKSINGFIRVIELCKCDNYDSYYIGFV